MEETGELGVTGEINDHIIVPLIAPVTGDGNFDALAALGTYTRVCSHNLTVFLRATTGFAYCLEDHVFVDQMNLILTIALPHQMVAGTPSVHAEHLERDIEHALHYVKDTLQPYGVRRLVLIAPIGNPTDKQTISYVSTVHERTGAEILLYNAPPVVFGGPCFSPEALRELLSMPFVLGVKHSGDEKSGFITLEGCAKAGKRYYEGKETHMALLLRQGAYGMMSCSSKPLTLLLPFIQIGNTRQTSQRLHWHWRNCPAAFPLTSGKRTLSDTQLNIWLQPDLLSRD